MKSLTAIDVVPPSVAASLLPIIRAMLVFLPTYQIAKRIELKWFAWLAGTLETLVVKVGGLLLGAFSSIIYLAAYKNIDLSEPLARKGSIEVIVDLETWAIIAPILTPLLVLMPIFSRWKKAGARIGVDWA